MTEGEAIVANATFALAAVTALLVIATLALAAGEARGRAGDRRADVELLIRPWERGPLMLEARVENFGPANARNLTLDLHMEDADGTVLRQSTASATLHEDVFPVGTERTMLPRPSPNLKLAEMAAVDLWVVAQWSWEDGRRLWPLSSRTQSRQWRVAAKSLVADYYESHALHPASVVGALREVYMNLDRIAVVLESHRNDELERLANDGTEPDSAGG